MTTFHYKIRYYYDDDFDCWGGDECGIEISIWDDLFYESKRFVYARYGAGEKLPTEFLKLGFGKGGCVLNYTKIIPNIDNSSLISSKNLYSVVRVHTIAIQ